VLLLGAAERLGLKMLAALEVEEKPSLPQIKAALDLVERLQRQRKEATEQAASEDGAGLEGLQELMDPAKAVERHHTDPDFIAALIAKGWLPPEKRRPGHPSPETLKLREDRERRTRRLNDQPPPEEDDSGLREMIGDQA
jgi:hypothetical protein